MPPVTRKAPAAKAPDPDTRAAFSVVPIATGDACLYLANCLDIMPKLSGVDCVIADPPYGTTAIEWDNVIPFNKMWPLIASITNDDSPICLFGAEPFSSHLRISNLLNYRYDWVWEKTMASNFASAKYQPLRYHEMISVFYKKAGKYFPISQPRAGRGWGRLSRTSGRVLDGSRSTSKATGLDHSAAKEKRGSGYRHYDPVTIGPKSIQRFISVSNANGTKLHPTQKPIALLEYLIKTYTKKGETVLDFTMGSGTTGVACANLSRKFIGIEIEPKYFDIACERITAAYAQGRLFA